MHVVGLPEIVAESKQCLIWYVVPLVFQEKNQLVEVFYNIHRDQEIRVKAIHRIQAAIIQTVGGYDHLILRIDLIYFILFVVVAAKQFLKFTLCTDYSHPYPFSLVGLIGTQLRHTLHVSTELATTHTSLTKL